MGQLKLDDTSSNNTNSENSWSKPLPDEPSSNSDFSTRSKLREWKPNAVKSSSHFSAPLPPPPSSPTAEEKPALPPRRESINKSLELEDKPKADISKPLPPKPPTPGVIVPLVTPKAAPVKPDKPPEIKKEEKNKQLYLRNEMGLECGHNILAKEVKKFNLKHVAKQPPKPKADLQADKPDSASPAPFLKPKPVVRPKPAPATKPEPVAKNELDITNLRSKLRPSKPPELSGNSSDPNQQSDTPPNNGRTNEESKSPNKQQNGHDPSETTKPPPPTTAPKEPPQRLLWHLEDLLHQRRVLSQPVLQTPKLPKKTCQKPNRPSLIRADLRRPKRSQKTRRRRNPRPKSQCHQSPPLRQKNQGLQETNSHLLSRSWSRSRPRRSCS